MSVETLVDKFVMGVIEESDYENLDRILNLVGEDNIPSAPETDNLIEMKDQLVQVAIKNKNRRDSK